MQHPISFSLLPSIHPSIPSSLSFPIFIFVSIFLFINYSRIPQACQALWQLPWIRYSPLHSLLREITVEPDQWLLRTRFPTVCLLSPQPSKGPQLSFNPFFLFFLSCLCLESSLEFQPKAQAAIINTAPFSGCS